MKRHGAVELGTSFVILLIIGIVVLGLVVGFLSRGINRAASKLDQSIDNIEFVHATSSNPVVAESSTLAIKAGESENLIVSVYNDGIYGDEKVGLSLTECTGSDGYMADTISMSSVSQSIGKLSDAGYKVIIKADASTGQDTYICNINAGSESQGDVYSTQLMIEVR